MYYVVCSIFH